MRKLIGVLACLLLFLLQLPAQNRTLQWAKPIGTDNGGNDQGNCIRTDAIGNTYIAGSISNTIDVDPGDDDGSKRLCRL